MNLVGRGVLALTEQGMVRKALSETGPGWRVARRFVAGSTLEAIRVAARLNSGGAAVSLDHLGEHVQSIDEAVAARDAYLACITRIADEGLDAEISVKLTMLGLGFEDGLAIESLGLLTAAARDAGTEVTIDMEESAQTEATITAFEKVQDDDGTLGVAVQAYLHRTRGDLDKIMAKGGRVRLCKGAYAEPPEVAVQSRAEVNEAFDALAGALMESPAVRPAIATHDHDRIAVARSLARHRSEPWEFQMLYGVRRRLQAELVAAGLPLRIYVPYGTAWYPYLTRRMAERPSNLLLFARSVIGP